jgi:hypothetical protein
MIYAQLLAVLMDNNSLLNRSAFFSPRGFNFHFEVSVLWDQSCFPSVNQSNLATQLLLRDLFRTRQVMFDGEGEKTSAMLTHDWSVFLDKYKISSNDNSLSR